MKVKIVYGAPCSGKSTFVAENVGDADLVYDYDRLLVACTNRTLHLAEKHALHWLILSLRESLYELAKKESKVEKFWLICSWVTDYVKVLFADVETEEIFLESTKAECYARLEKDETRPDKAEWQAIIDEWFEKYYGEKEMTEYELQQLYDKRADLWDAAKKFLDDHTDKNNCLSEKDAATSRRMLDELDGISAKIELHERQAELSAPVGTPILNAPMNTKYFGETEMVKTNYQTSKNYKSAFIGAVRKNFREVTDYLREGVDADGGFLCPSEMHDEIVTALEEENVMRQLSTVITTQSQHKISVVASKPSASWVNEGGEINLSNETFSQVTLDAYKLCAGVKISNELLQDSYYDLESHFVTQFSQVLGNAEEDAFINGGGANGVTKQPTGFLTTLSNVTDSQITTTAQSLSSDDILNLIYSVKRPYRKNASFLMHDSTLETIRKLKDTTLNYIWTPSVVEGEPDKLFGHKAFTSAFFPPAESGKPLIAFGDFSKYIIADRAVRTFRPLHELYALNDLSAFLMIERVDGVLVDTDAIHILKLK